MPHIGYFPRFGWKPIEKYSFSGVNSYAINPVPCDWSRKVLILFDVQQSGGYNILNFKVNDDGLKHQFALRYVGWDGAIVENNSGGINSFSIPISHSLGSKIHGSILLFSHASNHLALMGESWAYYDPTHFSINSFGGSYTGAGPHSRIDFVSGGALNMAGNIEFFESVYVF